MEVRDIKDESKDKENENKVKVLFLGPKAENQDFYESLIIEVIRDACFLRKNFHPEDKVLITEHDKLTQDYQETAAAMKEHLHSILAELKKGVPWYHPRYIGHMFGDLMLPSIIGYFSTILYNPNNVVGEVSTATTKMEIKYIDALCKMVGYGPCAMSGKNAWGHLCSGGTSANIEALWIARNLKYYPLSVKLVSALDDKDVFFIKDIYFDFHKNDIKNLSYQELFDLRPQDILDLKDHIATRCEQENIDFTKIETFIAEYSIQQLGTHSIHKMIGDEVPLPIVYISKSSHYSWKKAMDILGLGQKQLIEVAMDEGYRMDFNDFTYKFNTNKTKGLPVLAVIGILSSTKQGSIDPIDKILKFRSVKEKERHSFFVHIDAAYGGYLCSLFRDEVIKKTNFLSSKGVLPFLNKNDILFTNSENKNTSINKEWCNKITAIKNADSITIDPHKMGYIPYPAGSILFKDTRSKEFISYLPSYLNKPSDENKLELAFLGQWTLEGSRPGAMATSCYLTNKVMPLNQNNHGILIRNAILSANSFWESIKKFNTDVTKNKGFKIVPTYIPETNIVSYVLACPNVISKIKYLNILTNKLYEAFSIKGDSIIPAQNFMVAKESFASDDMPNGPFLKKCGINSRDKEKTKEEITIISSVFMNPLSKYLADDFYDAFFKEMVIKAESILSYIMLQIITDKNKGERLKILWIENEAEVNIMKQILQFQSEIGKYLNIYFTTNYQEAKKLINTEFDCIILDLNLKDKNHVNYDDSKIDNAVNLIKSVSDEAKQKRILFYSAYLSNKSFKSQIVSALKKHMIMKAYQCIPKSTLPTTNKERDSQDMKLIINGIFEILNKS